VIPLSSENPYAMEIVASMQSIADTYGIEMTAYANQGQPNQWAAGIEQAIDGGADAIVLLAGTDPQLVVPQLTRAKEAGVDVIVTHLYQNGTEPPAEVRDLIAGYTTAPFNEAAALLADYAIANGDGTNRILYITSDEVGPAIGQKESFLAEASELCPGCSVDVVNVPVSDWASKLMTETQSYLVAHPDTTWIVPIYDSMVPGVIAGINQAGKASDVKIASFNGTPSILQLIIDGSPIVADIGESVDWLGHSAMDSIFRVLATGSGLAGGDDKMPLRILDVTNIESVGNPPSSTMGYGDAYVAGYRMLWGN
jgi:ribose transport system substrate-binding protein